MKIAFGMLAVAGLAAAAGADFITVPQNHRMMSAVASQLDSVQIETTVLYSSIPGPYSAFGVASFASNDDYTTTTGGAGQFECDQLRFVGGVGQVGGILDFFFLDSTGTKRDLLVWRYAWNAGDFIWTITNIGELADHTGRLQIQTRGSTTGRWFMTTTAPMCWLEQPDHRPWHARPAAYRRVRTQHTHTRLTCSARPRWLGCSSSSSLNSEFRAGVRSRLK